jgi:hypothetical protein
LNLKNIARKEIEAQKKLKEKTVNVTVMIDHLKPLDRSIPSFLAEKASSTTFLALASGSQKVAFGIGRLETDHFISTNLMLNNGSFTRAHDSRNAPTGTSRTRKGKQGKVVTCDLHGCSIAGALAIASTEISNRPPNCEKINLIVGKGLHSTTTGPHVSSSLMNEITKWGYHCRLMDKNTGILEVFPFQIEKPATNTRTRIELNRMSEL